MTDEDLVKQLEARLKSIPGWLDVVLLMNEIRKIKARMEERFLSG